MSATPGTYYVTVYHEWIRQRRHERWVPVMITTSEQPTIPQPTIAVFEVDVPTKTEAAAVVVEWLARGEPASMAVRRLVDAEQTRQQPLASERESAEAVAYQQRLEQIWAARKRAEADDQTRAIADEIDRVETERAAVQRLYAAGDISRNWHRDQLEALDRRLDELAARYDVRLVELGMPEGEP